MAKKSRYFKYTFSKAGPTRKIRIPGQRPPVYLKTQPVKKALLRPRPDFAIHRRTRREDLESDPYEKYAVPKWQVTGFQSERIVYKMAMRHGHVPGVDFTFQTSSAGGRLEVGGLVADFIWPRKMLVLQVQGPTHEEYLQGKKDSEQRDMLENMGYTVMYVDLDTVHSQQRLNDFFIRYIDPQPTIGGMMYGSLSNDDSLAGMVTTAQQILGGLVGISGNA